MGDKGLSESENVARSSALNFGKDEEQLTRRQIDFLERRGELHAEAVALAPSVPSGSFSWAEALVRHGKFDGAIAKFEHANARGPHWADPLTVRAGATRSPPRAISGTRGSATNARRNSRRTGPSCICWGQALDKLGTLALAVEQYRKAIDLDLTDAERKSLDRCCD
jgi:tetratricopeptide (TPR) repeat protein